MRSRVRVRAGLFEQTRMTMLRKWACGTINGTVYGSDVERAKTINR